MVRSKNQGQYIFNAHAGCLLQAIVQYLTTQSLALCVVVDINAYFGCNAVGGAVVKIPEIKKGQYFSFVFGHPKRPLLPGNGGPHLPARFQVYGLGIGRNITQGNGLVINGGNGG